MIQALFLATVGCILLALLWRNAVVLTVVVAISAAYPRFLGLGVGADGGALTMARVGVVILIVWFGLKVVAGEESPITRIARTRTGQYWLASGAAFGLVALASSLLSGSPKSSLVYSVDWYLATVGMALLTGAYVARPRDRELFLLALTLAGLLSCLLAFVESFLGRSLFSYLNPSAISIVADRDALFGQTREDFYRAMAQFSNPMYLMVFLSVVAPCAMVLSATAESRMHRYAGRVFLCLYPIAVLLTGSRSGVALMLWNVLFAVSMRQMRRTGRSVYGRVLLAGALVGSALLAIAVMANVPAWYIENATTDELRSVAARLGQYFVAFPWILRSPLLGNGAAGNLEEAFGFVTIDSLSLVLMVEYGVAGLLAFLGVTITLVWVARRRMAQALQQPGDATLVAFGLLSFHVGLMTILLFNVVAFKPIYMFSFCIGGLALGLTGHAGARDRSMQDRDDHPVPERSADACDART